MIHLDASQRLFISEDTLGYADQLVDEKTVPRRVDLLTLGFSYAVNENLQPAEEYKRHQLVVVASLNEVQLPIEAVAQWYARELDYELQDDRELLEFICAISISGIRALQKRWEVKRKSQIQWDIINLKKSKE